MELYKKYRPKNLSELIGQDSSVRTLQSFLKGKKVPHAILLTGPSGCGKTTAARILRRSLGCNKSDYQEINSAEARGIDTIRDIHRRLGLAPVSGSCRIWVLDEVHKLTGDAQTALLKTLEDGPSHVYFMLATTDPHKLLPTIKTRCTEIKMRMLTQEELCELIADVIGKETGVDGVKWTGGNGVIEKIAEVADGSARKALVLLGQVIALDPKDQMDAIQKADVKKQAIELARELINPRGDWKKCAAILKDLEDDPEGVRRMILAYANSVLLGGGGLMNRAYLILECFSSPVWEMGKPGLTRAAYEVFSQK